jgi:hypothetical protein
MAHLVHDLQQRMPRLRPASKLLLLAWVHLLLLLLQQIQSAAGLSHCVCCFSLCISYKTCHSTVAEHAAGSRLGTLSIILGDQQLKRSPAPVRPQRTIRRRFDPERAASTHTITRIAITGEIKAQLH